MPPLLLAIVFGPAAAGWFGLGQRLMSLPIRLLSQAARQVFLGEAAQRDPRGLSRLFVRSSAMFLAFALIGMAPILFAGPWLFEVCFGPAWRTSGEMVQLLVPLYTTRFVVTPVSQTLNVLGRQNLHLISSSLDAGLLIVSFTLAWWLEFSILSTVALFSACSTFAYLVYFYLAWKSIQTAVARMPVPAEPAPARAPVTLAD
jgi:O-antigen/teichoic acid export membrane protein